MEAASKANALNFIQNNQFQLNDRQTNIVNYGQGFERLVGPKGSQHSGGQKQRIAIARAIARNRNILLLDEATSVLDPESEKSVQEVLNNIMQEKTSLSVAHRISTIKNSDQIFVIEKGKLVEQGTFDQFMANKSHFCRLNANLKKIKKNFITFYNSLKQKLKNTFKKIQIYQVQFSFMKTNGFLKLICD
ncbi:hypothetical protein ABPG72_008139 [Tetrahymena utriculariae]